MTYQVVDNVARLKEVETGLTNGLETEIKAGISEGDVLVLYPSFKVKNGVRLEIPHHTAAPLS